MAFGELTKLIFLKTRDEKKPRKKGQPYEFQIKTNETPQRLATRIKAMYAIERQQETDVFNDDIKIDDTTEERGASLARGLTFSGINTVE